MNDDDTQSSRHARRKHVEPLFAALGDEPRQASSGVNGMKIVWVVLAAVVLAALVWKQAF